MNPPSANPLRATLSWMTNHARFPASRLEPRAVTLLCMAGIATAEEADEQRRFLIKSSDPAQTSALRAHGLRRSRVHFKCDNSAKV